MAKSKHPSQKKGEQHRPSIATDELKNEICRLIAIEKLSARKACDRVGLTFDTFWRWLSSDAALSEQYRQAKEMQLEQMAEEIIDIPDEPPQLFIGDSGEAKVDAAYVQLIKLKVDSRKWVVSRLLPKKYGDRVTQEITGPNGGPVSTTTLTKAEFEEVARGLLKEV